MARETPAMETSSCRPPETLSSNTASFTIIWPAVATTTVSPSPVANRVQRLQPPRLYELVEIPAALFNSIQHEPFGTFQTDAPVIPCRDPGWPRRRPRSFGRSDAHGSQHSASRWLVHAELARA